jgi:hypothetical protein
MTHAFKEAIKFSHPQMKCLATAAYEKFVSWSATQQRNLLLLPPKQLVGIPMLRSQTDNVSRFLGGFVLSDVSVTQCDI